ncbi:MAG: peptide deformylase, partial [Chloroflexota bacterium]
ARVFQHEIDHLDGILYIDRATEIWRAAEEGQGDDDDGAGAEPAPEQAAEM